MNKQPSIVFFLLCVAFLTYSFTIYLGLHDKASPHSRLKEAGDGKLVWQKHNCQSCHQLYGLGGYLGPDLTNVSSKYKNDMVLEALISSGNTIMPSYSMEKNEMRALLCFLHEMDSTGNADPRAFSRGISGMIYNK
jgi:nitric oxide reductase subunit C